MLKTIAGSYEMKWLLWLTVVAMTNGFLSGCLEGQDSGATGDIEGNREPIVITFDGPDGVHIVRTTEEVGELDIIEYANADILDFVVDGEETSDPGMILTGGRSELPRLDGGRLVIARNGNVLQVAADSDGGQTSVNAEANDDATELRITAEEGVGVFRLYGMEDQEERERLLGLLALVSLRGEAELEGLDEVERCGPLCLTIIVAGGGFIAAVAALVGYHAYRECLRAHDRCCGWNAAQACGQGNVDSCEYACAFTWDVMIGEYEYESEGSSSGACQYECQTNPSTNDNTNEDDLTPSWTFVPAERVYPYKPCLGCR